MAKLRSSWDLVDVVAERLDVDPWVSRNVVELLEAENTIPFIARYRREQTNNMEAEKLREVMTMMEELKSVQAKISSVAAIVEKVGKLTDELKRYLSCAQSLPEVENLYAPFKAGSKRTLAERARELGLEPLALSILNRPREANMNDYVKPGVKGLSTLGELETGVQHIIADIISKNKLVMDTVRNLCKSSHVTVETSPVQTKPKKEVKAKVKAEGSGKVKVENSHKYEQYMNFQCAVRNLKPHQILAINRAEAQKFISVKVVFPGRVKDNYVRFCQSKWLGRDVGPSLQGLITKSIEDAYSRLIQPLMCRHIRADLTKEAEKASVDVFASNLKRLLLTPPVRGKVVCGLDPGFKNGCKMAVISQTGQILRTDVLFINRPKEGQKLKNAVLHFRCETIAIGNGTACRETESFVSDLIQQNYFSPLNVMYCIVSEDGASVYSVSAEAKKEMPDLDVNLRSAVSIARRLQDPLAELVKIEPKHIGVGMYQHDISESQLQKSLDSVIEECVSFVGVDINSCSECLLRRVAGLNVTRAKKIIEWREKNGPFRNREQIQLVKGVGPKSFVQCAGFVRILPSTSNNIKREVIKDEPDEVEDTAASATTGRKRKATAANKGKVKKAKAGENSDPNPLDRTCIHPESYSLASRVLEVAGLTSDLIGEEKFIGLMKTWLRHTGTERLAEQMGVGIPTMQLVLDGLTQHIEHDIREAFEKPLFKKGLLSMSDLKVHSKASGRVGNVTHFGAFVDIGVGRDGLIHVSQMRPHNMKGKKCLELGDKVEVEVMNIDINKGRIGLRLLNLL